MYKYELLPNKCKKKAKNLFIDEEVIMYNIQKCQLAVYTLNEPNSTPAEAADLTYPGHPALWALDIKSITVEEKTALLKQLNVGSEITFNIDQEITLFIPNLKTKEYDDLSFMVEGEGRGEISEILDLDITLDDNEYQEISIKLIRGFAENL